MKKPASDCPRHWHLNSLLPYTVQIFMFINGAGETVNKGRDPNRGCGRWICSEKPSPIHAEDAPSLIIDLSVYDKVGLEPAPWYRGKDQKLRKKNMVCESTSSSALCVTLQIKI